MSQMTGVSLFAGVGGFDLAMDRQGYKVVANVEIDKACQNVLATHFPSVQQFGDISQVKGSDLIDAGFNPSTGVITGGFPCQDLSVAGKRAGLAGKRSGLFWEIVRLLEETKSEWFILENVPGLLTSNNGADFGIVLGALDELGYCVGWRVLDAQHFGVPQRRRRVFIVGKRNSDGSDIAKVLFKPESLSGDTQSIQQKGSETASDSARCFGQTGFAAYTKGVTTLTATSHKRPEDNIIVFYGNRVADIRIQDDKVNTLQARMGTGGNNMPLVFSHNQISPSIGKGVSPTLRAFGKGMSIANESMVRRLTPVECERLQGFPDGWTEGQSDTQRYKQMGNAVAVPVVEWLVKRVKEVSQGC